MQLVTQPAVRPVRTKIADLLADLEQSPSWLAEKAGVPRSTVSRILKGDRTPTPETLATLAPILGVSLEQLVADTDAAERVAEAASLIALSHYEDAVEKYIAAEREQNIANDKVRVLAEQLDREEQRRRDAERRLDATERERDDARRSAAQNDENARLYSRALASAVGEIARLKADIAELGTQFSSARRTGRVAAILAAAAAAASTATFFHVRGREAKSKSTKGE